MIKKFRTLKENIRIVVITPACVLIIILLMGACVTGSHIAKNNNESTSPVMTVDEKPVDQTATSSPQTQINKLPQFTATGESENSKVSKGENEIVCRTRIITGTHFKKKICLTKKAWAEADKKNSRKMDRFDRDLRNQTDRGFSADPSTMGQMPR